MRAEVTAKLHQVVVKINFSFDMWSGPNRHAYQAIVAHWLDPSMKLHTALLSLHRFRGAHSGFNQADHFWTTLEQYQIHHLVGKFNVDNATNNDTALCEIAKRLTNAGYASFDPIRDRLRCFGHVLNLAVKAFLWGANVDAFERELNEEAMLDDDMVELLRWRKKGPLGKLHNVLTYIRMTPQRRDQFQKQVLEIYPDETVFTPRVGNITRWSSDYEAIQRAFRLREPIEQFIREAIRLNLNGERNGSPEALSNDQLLPEDWVMLRCVMDILEPFKVWTNRLQLRYSNGCVADVLPAMDELLAHMEDMKAFYTQEGNSAQLVTSINNGWDILNKYVCGLPSLDGYGSSG